MGGGGGNPIKKFMRDPLGETVKLATFNTAKFEGGKLQKGNNFNTAANVAVNAATAGLVGYDAQSGKLKKGVQIKMADEGLGEVTGRNMKRKMMNEAGTKLKEAELEEERQMGLLQEERATRDRMLSGAAAGFRKSARAKGKKLGGERDYLGL